MKSHLAADTSMKPGRSHTHVSKKKKYEPQVRSVITKHSSKKNGADRIWTRREGKVVAAGQLVTEEGQADENEMLPIWETDRFHPS